MMGFLLLDCQYISRTLKFSFQSSLESLLMIAEFFLGCWHGGRSILSNLTEQSLGEQIVQPLYKMGPYQI